MEQANHARDEITKLGWDKHYLILEDVAVVARHPDGLFTLERERFPAASNILGCTKAGFLAGFRGRAADDVARKGPVRRLER